MRSPHAFVVLVLVVGCSLPRAVIGGGTGNDVGVRDSGPGVLDVGADVGSDAQVIVEDDSGIDGGPGNDGGTDAGRDSGMDAGPVDAWAPECTVNATRCGGDGLETCVAPGVWGPGVACILGCLAAPGAHCGVVDASNVDDATLFVGTADVTVADDTVVDYGSCASTPLSVGGGMVTPMAVMQTSGATSVCVVAVHTLTVSGRLTLHGAMPLVILATGDVEITGVIDVSAMANVPGPGGAAPGMGAGAGMNGEHDNYSDGGGGGGALGGNGGGGGDGGGDIGIFGARARGGAGGVATTVPDLRPLVGGSGGGSGRGGSGLGGGGAGGGAIQITSRTQIHVTGRIVAGGGGGAGGGLGNMADDNLGSGGGGGSGGAILLEAPVLRVETGAFLAANGGGGGSSAACTASTGGGMRGQDGHPDGTAATGGVRAACATYGANGGSGSAAGTQPGTSGAGNSASGANGGGAGGGAGMIVLRSRTPTIAGGALSPGTAPAQTLLDVIVR